MMTLRHELRALPGALYEALMREAECHFNLLQVETDRQERMALLTAEFGMQEPPSPSTRKPSSETIAAIVEIDPQVRTATRESHAARLAYERARAETEVRRLATRIALLTAEMESSSSSTPGEQEGTTASPSASPGTQRPLHPSSEGRVL